MYKWNGFGYIFLFIAVILYATLGWAKEGTPIQSYTQMAKGAADGDAPSLAALKRAAQAGSTDAEALLGAVYAGGRGVARDYRKAYEWSLKAALHGDAKSEVLLGFLYMDGKGVTKDSGKAAQWYRKAASQGNAIATLTAATITNTAATIAPTHGKKPPCALGQRVHLALTGGCS